MIIAILAILGLCFGSFINAAVWRIHEQQKKIKPKSKKSDGLSIVHGRSMCTNCRHSLAWHDLLPVLSWLRLGGKCRYCHKPISWQYPLVELATAVLFIVSYVFWPDTFNSTFFGFWLVFLVGFMALAVYDLRWMILPNRIIFPMQGLAAIYALATLAFSSGNKQQAALALLLSVLSSAGLFYALYQVSRGKWIGGGDVKLAVILGLLLASPAKTLLMIFIASLAGSLISLPLLMTGRLKQNSRLPFGPLLIAGTIIVYLFGASLIVWYEQQFILV